MTAPITGPTNIGSEAFESKHAKCTAEGCNHMSDLEVWPHACLLAELVEQVATLRSIQKDLRRLVERSRGPYACLAVKKDEALKSTFFCGRAEGHDGKHDWEGGE